MNWIRHLNTGLFVVLALALVPGGPAAAEELAVIDDIVVNGQRPDEPTAENFSVEVAATGVTLPARRGMWLSANDMVRTGAGVQAVLRYPDPDPEVERLIFVDEISFYQVIDSTTLKGFFGRLFASVSDLFSVITPAGLLGVRGTEFEVVIAPDGAVEIQVLEGAVAFAPSAVEEAPTADGSTRPAAEPPPDEGQPPGPAIEIGVLSGDQKTVQLALTVTNGCPETERFFIDSPAALPWVQIVAEPQPVEVPGGGSATAETEIWLDAAGVEPGIYRGAIVLRCDECDTCTLTRRAAPLVVEVAGPAGESEARPVEDVAAARPPTEPLRIQALERLSLESDARAAAPDGMAQDEVVEVLGWTDAVFVAVQPTYAAAGDPPHFDDVEERSRAFRAARYAAVWEDDPEARAQLGNVYKDWGEDRRASKAYKEAALADGSLNDSADFIASWAEANRRSGRLEMAQEQAERAVDLDPDSGRALVALGNVYRGIAGVVTETDAPEEATVYLERSIEAYKAASGRGDPAGADRDRRTRGVADTNLAETYTALAKKALATGQTAEADRRLIEALQAVRAADSAYPKAENPFLLLAEGQVQQERARLARARGDEEGSSRQLELAQRSYSAALEKHKDMAPAHYRIATVYEDRGDTESAEREYEKSVETQPTYSPSYDRLGALKEIKSPGSGTVYLDRDRKFVSPEKLGQRFEVVQPPGSQVPRLIGMVQIQAEHALVETGFALGEISREPGVARVGTVIRQRPAAGDRAAPGTPVDLTLALPTGSFAMPDVRGLSLDEARLRLLEHGLGSARIRRVEKRGQTRPEVTGQSPRPGRKVTAGKAVELEVAVPKPVKVPGLVGESEDEALRKLQKQGLAGGRITRETSCEGEGRVLRQSPSKGTRLPPGSAVGLVVATSGSDVRTVPDLVGVMHADAERLLARSDFRLGQVDRHESDQPEGTVLAQQPEARAVLGAGCPVALTVAKPVALVEVPNFVGESLAELQRTVSRLALAIAGVGLGQVTFVDSRQSAEGTVVRQSPEAGARVRRESKIDLWVARGAPAPRPRVTVPNLGCRKAQHAADVLLEMGLRYTFRNQGGEVVRLDPKVGSRVDPGTLVTLYLGNCVD